MLVPLGDFCGQLVLAVGIAMVTLQVGSSFSTTSIQTNILNTLFDVKSVMASAPMLLDFQAQNGVNDGKISNVTRVVNLFLEQEFSARWALVLSQWLPRLTRRLPLWRFLAVNTEFPNRKEHSFDFV